MIQRIQTLFLILAAICFSLLLFLPIKEINVDGQLKTINALSAFNKEFGYTISYSIVSGFILLGMATSIASIFSYKQRYLQIRLCTVIIILALVSVMLLNLTASVEFYGSFESIPLVSNVILVLPIVFSYLASVFIKKDIKLIKSADRLR